MTKKISRKVLPMLAVMALVFALAGCGGSGSPASNGGGGTGGGGSGNGGGGGIDHFAGVWNIQSDIGTLTITATSGTSGTWNFPAQTRSGTFTRASLSATTATVRSGTGTGTPAGNWNFNTATNVLTWTDPPDPALTFSRQ